MTATPSHESVDNRSVAQSRVQLVELMIAAGDDPSSASKAADGLWQFLNGSQYICPTIQSSSQIMHYMWRLWESGCLKNNLNLTQLIKERMPLAYAASVVTHENQMLYMSDSNEEKKKYETEEIKSSESEGITVFGEKKNKQKRVAFETLGKQLERAVQDAVVTERGRIRAEIRQEVENGEEEELKCFPPSTLPGKIMFPSEKCLRLLDLSYVDDSPRAHSPTFCADIYARLKILLKDIGITQNSMYEPPAEAMGDDDQAITSLQKGKLLIQRTGVPEIGLSNENIDSIIGIIRDSEEQVFVPLTIVSGEIYHPYDLTPISDYTKRNVFCLLSKAGFFYGTNDGFSDFVSILDWKKERHVFHLVRDLCFFRHFRLAKAFMSWKRFLKTTKKRNLIDFLKKNVLVVLPDFRESIKAINNILARYQTDIYQESLRPRYCTGSYKNFLDKTLNSLMVYKEISSIYAKEALEVIVDCVLKLDRNVQSKYESIEEFQPYKYKRESITLMKERCEQQKLEFIEAKRIRNMSDAFVHYSCLLFKTKLISITDEWVSRNISRPLMHNSSGDTVCLTMSVGICEDHIKCDFNVQKIALSFEDLIFRFVETVDYLGKELQECRNLKDASTFATTKVGNLGEIDNFPLLNDEGMINMFRNIEFQITGHLRLLDEKIATVKAYEQKILQVKCDTDSNIFKRSKLICDYQYLLNEEDEYASHLEDSYYTSPHLCCVEASIPKKYLQESICMRKRDASALLKTLFEEQLTLFKNILNHEMEELRKRPKEILPFLDLEDYIKMCQNSLPDKIEEIDLIIKTEAIVKPMLTGSLSALASDIKKEFQSYKVLLTLAHENLEIERPEMKFLLIKKMKECEEVATKAIETANSIDSDSHRENVDALNELLVQILHNKEVHKTLLRFVDVLGARNALKDENNTCVDDCITICRARNNFESAIGRWNIVSKRWLKEKICELDFKKVKDYVSKLKQSVENSMRYIPEPLLHDSLKRSLEAFSRAVNLSEKLVNSIQSDHYWRRIFEALSLNAESSTSVTLDMIRDEKVRDQEVSLLKILDLIGKEKKALTTLKELKEFWSQCEVVFKQAESDDLLILDDTMNYKESLEDHCYRMKTLGTEFEDPKIVKEVEFWTLCLVRLSDLLDNWYLAQEMFIQLEAVLNFSKYAEQLTDVRNTFYKLKEDFNVNLQYFKIEGNALFVDLTFKKRGKFKKNNKSYSYFSQLFDRTILELEKLKISLEAGFQDICQKCPLLQILPISTLLLFCSSNATPVTFANNVAKLFPGLRSVHCEASQGSDITIVGYTDDYNFKEEKLLVQDPIILKQEDGIEAWIGKVDKQLKVHLQNKFESLMSTVRKENPVSQNWMFDFPSQLVLVALRVIHTYRTTVALEGLERSVNRNPLKALEIDSIKTIADVAKLICMATASETIFLQCVMTIHLYNRDVTHRLISSGCANVDDFEWASRIRVYFDSGSNNVVTKIFSSSASYGFEYLPQSYRVIITPQTERCIAQIANVLGSSYVTCLAGAAGSGKKTSLSELASLCGKLIHNISVDSSTSARDFEKVVSACSRLSRWVFINNIDNISQMEYKRTNYLNTLLERTFFDRLGKGSEKNVSGIFFSFPVYNPSRLFVGYCASSIRIIRIEIPNMRFLNEALALTYGIVPEKNVLDVFEITFNRLKSTVNPAYWGLGIFGTIAATWRWLSENKNINIFSGLRAALELFFQEQIDGSFFKGIGLPDREFVKQKQTLSRAMLIETSDQNDWYVEDKKMQLLKATTFSQNIIIVGHPFSGKTSLIKKCFEQVSTEKNNALRMHTIYFDSLKLEEFWGSFICGHWKPGNLASTIEHDSLKEMPSWYLLIGSRNYHLVEHLLLTCKDGIISLPTGMELNLANRHFFFETTSLQFVSPSVISRCCIVTFAKNTKLWKSILASTLSSFATKYISFKFPVSPIYLSMVTLFVKIFNEHRLLKMLKVSLTREEVTHIVMKAFDCLFNYYTVSLDFTTLPVLMCDHKKLFMDCSYLAISAMSLSLHSLSKCEERDNLNYSIINACVEAFPEAKLPSKGYLWNHYYDPTTAKFTLFDTLVTSDIPHPNSSRVNYMTLAFHSNGQSALLVGLPGSGKSLAVEQLREQVVSLREGMSIELSSCSFKCGSSSSSVQICDFIFHAVTFTSKCPLDDIEESKCIFDIDDLAALDFNSYMNVIDYLKPFFETKLLFERKSLKFKSCRKVPFALVCGLSDTSSNRMLCYSRKLLPHIGTIEVSREGNFLTLKDMAASKITKCTSIEGTFFKITNSTVAKYVGLIEDLEGKSQNVPESFIFNSCAFLKSLDYLCDIYRQGVTSQLALYDMFIHDKYYEVFRCFNFAAGDYEESKILEDEMNEQTAFVTFPEFVFWDLCKPLVCRLQRILQYRSSHAILTYEYLPILVFALDALTKISNLFIQYCDISAGCKNLGLWKAKISATVLNAILHDQFSVVVLPFELISQSPACFNAIEHLLALKSAPILDLLEDRDFDLIRRFIERSLASGEYATKQLLISTKLENYFRVVIVKYLPYGKSDLTGSNSLFRKYFSYTKVPPITFELLKRYASASIGSHSYRYSSSEISQASVFAATLFHKLIEMERSEGTLGPILPSIQTFELMLSTFHTHFKREREKIKDSVNIMGTFKCKIEEDKTNLELQCSEESKRRVEELRNIMNESEIKLKSFQKDLLHQKRELSEKESALQTQEMELKRLKDKVRDEKARVTPAVLSTKGALKALRPQDFTELANLRYTDNTVVLKTFTALSTFFELPVDLPTLIPELSSLQFISRLEKLDKDELSHAQVLVIREFVESKIATPELIELHSRALRVFFLCMMATYNYVISKYENVIPWEKDILQKEKDLEEKRKTFNSVKSELFKSAGFLTAFQTEFKCANNNYQSALIKYEESLAKKETLTNILSSLKRQMPAIEKKVDEANMSLESLIADEMFRAFQLIVRKPAFHSNCSAYLEHARHFCQSNDVPFSIKQIDYGEKIPLAVGQTRTKEEYILSKLFAMTNVPGGNILIDPDYVLDTSVKEPIPSSAVITVSKDTYIEGIKKLVLSHTYKYVFVEIVVSVNVLDAISLASTLIKDDTLNQNIYVVVRSPSDLTFFQLDILSKSSIMHLNIALSWIEKALYEATMGSMGLDEIYSAEQQVHALRLRCKDIMWSVAEKYNRIDFDKINAESMESLRKVLSILGELENDMSSKQDLIESSLEQIHRGLDLSRNFFYLWFSTFVLASHLPLVRYRGIPLLRRILDFCYKGQPETLSLGEALKNILCGMKGSDQIVLLSLYSLTKSEMSVCQAVRIAETFLQNLQNLSSFENEQFLNDLSRLGSFGWSAVSQNAKRVETVDEIFRDTFQYIKSNKRALNKFIVTGDFRYLVGDSAGCFFSCNQKLLLLSALCPPRICQIVFTNPPILAQSDILKLGVFAVNDILVASQNLLCVCVLVETPSAFTILQAAQDKSILVRNWNYPVFGENVSFEESFNSTLRLCFEGDEWLVLDLSKIHLQLNTIMLLVKTFSKSIDPMLKLTTKFRIWIAAFANCLKTRNNLMSLELLQNSPDVCYFQSITRFSIPSQYIYASMNYASQISSELSRKFQMKMFDMNRIHENDSKELIVPGNWFSLIANLIFSLWHDSSTDESRFYVDRPLLHSLMYTIASWLANNVRLKISLHSFIKILKHFGGWRSQDQWGYGYNQLLKQYFSELSTERNPITSCDSRQTTVLSTILQLTQENQSLLDQQIYFEDPLISGGGWCAAAPSNITTWRQWSSSNALLIDLHKERRYKILNILLSVVSESTVNIPTDCSSNLQALFSSQVQILEKKIQILYSLFEKLISYTKEESKMSESIIQAEIDSQMSYHFPGIGISLWPFVMRTCQRIKRYSGHLQRVLIENMTSPNSPLELKDMSIDSRSIIDVPAFFTTLKALMCSQLCLDEHLHELFICFGSPPSSNSLHLGPSIYGIMSIGSEWDNSSKVFRRIMHPALLEPFRCPPGAIYLISKLEKEKEIEDNKFSFFLPIWTYFWQKSINICSYDLFMADSSCEPLIASHAYFNGSSLGAQENQQHEAQVLLVFHSFVHWMGKDP